MKLYDAYGREVDTAELRDEQAAPTMAGVRNIYSMMHPSVGLTPEKLIAIQREAEAGDPYLYLELAEEMEEKDLHYLAVIGTRKQAVAGAELIVTPASEAAEACARPIWCATSSAAARSTSKARSTISSTRSARVSRRPRSSGTRPGANGSPSA
jgi:Protein of unknown function (DUF935)